MVRPHRRRPGRNASRRHGTNPQHRRLALGPRHDPPRARIYLGRSAPPHARAARHGLLRPFRHERSLVVRGSLYPRLPGRRRPPGASMIPLARHTLLELGGCDAALLNDPATLEALLLEAVRKAGGTVVT